MGWLNGHLKSDSRKALKGEIEKGESSRETVSTPSLTRKQAEKSKRKGLIC